MPFVFRTLKRTGFILNRTRSGLLREKYLYIIYDCLSFGNIWCIILYITLAVLSKYLCFPNVCFVWA